MTKDYSKIFWVVLIAVVLSVAISSYINKPTQPVVDSSNALYKVRLEGNLIVFSHEGQGESSFVILGSGEAKKVTYYSERDIIVVEDVQKVNRVSFKDDFFKATVQRLFFQLSWGEFRDMMVNLCETKHKLIKENRIRWGWLEQGCVTFWAKVRERNREFKAGFRKKEDIFDRVQAQHQATKPTKKGQSETK